MKVINANGVAVDYDTAVVMMDDEIREQLSAELAPCSEQEFFSEYEIAHAEEYGEVWELSKKNPVY